MNLADHPVVEGFYSIEPLGPRSKQLVYACKSESGKYVHLWDDKGGHVDDTLIETWFRIKPEWINVKAGWTEARLRFRRRASAQDRPTSFLQQGGTCSSD